MVWEVKPKYYRRTFTQAEHKLEQCEMVHKNLTTYIERGLCPYITKGIDYREVNINSSFEEFLAVEIKLNNNYQKMLIINEYHSGSCEEGNKDCLNELLVNIGSNWDYGRAMICGDMNFQDINWEDISYNGSVDSKDFKFIEATRDAYVKQHIDKPTRDRGSVSLSNRDLIITRDDTDVTDINWIPYWEKWPRWYIISIIM